MKDETRQKFIEMKRKGDRIAQEIADLERFNNRCLWVLGTVAVILLGLAALV